MERNGQHSRKSRSLMGRQGQLKPEDQGIVHVLAIGPRNDLAVYQNAAQEPKRLSRHRSPRIH